MDAGARFHGCISQRFFIGPWTSSGSYCETSLEVPKILVWLSTIKETLELAPIGRQCSVLEVALNDQTAVSLPIAAFGTRLLARPLRTPKNQTSLVFEDEDLHSEEYTNRRIPHYVNQLLLEQLAVASDGPGSCFSRRATGVHFYPAPHGFRFGRSYGASITLLWNTMWRPLPCPWRGNTLFSTISCRMREPLTPCFRAKSAVLYKLSLRKLS